MTLDQYQALALRTSREGDPDELLVNWTLGLCGESGEFADIVKKQRFHGHKQDKEALKNELGDVLWYVANLCETLGLSMGDVAMDNVRKLAKRYPEGFSPERSIKREDLKNEDKSDKSTTSSQ